MLLQILSGDKSVHIETCKERRVDVAAGDFVVFSNGHGTMALCEVLVEPTFYDGHAAALSDLGKRGKLLRAVPRDHADEPVGSESAAEAAFRWIYTTRKSSRGKGPQMTAEEYEAAAVVAIEFRVVFGCLHKSIVTSIEPS